MVLSGLQDQLAPLKSWLFPRRVYLQLEDQAFTAMVLDGERVAWLERVPLPEGLCVNGEPKAVEALGDLLGDLLVERGYASARVKAVLPRTATAWRVIEWPDASWPEHPELVVRQQQLELELPWSLQDADLLLEPLPGDQPRSLVVAVQRSVLEAWIEVCNQASVALDAVEALPICLWRAVSSQIQAGEGVQVLLQLEPDQSWLLALDQGQPLGEWLMPATSDPEELSLALARWRRRYSPTAAIVLGGDPASAEALGCPASGTARVEGVPALWGLAEAELRR
ncbi:MAG: hypothetical protein RLZZ54_894 [Cyanobacteriota bacterium]